MDHLNQGQQPGETTLSEWNLFVARVILLFAEGQLHDAMLNAPEAVEFLQLKVFCFRALVAVGELPRTPRTSAAIMDLFAEIRNLREYDDM